MSRFRVSTCELEGGINRFIIPCQDSRGVSRGESPRRPTADAASTFPALATGYGNPMVQCYAIFVRIAGSTAVG